MKIAVYSGSFDPLHIGHYSIMEQLTHEEAFDWVYLVVSPQNPFKEAGKALTGQARYEAAVAAVCRHPELHVWVDDIELHMDPPHYSIYTLEALKQREPDNEFTLVMGADCLAQLEGWRFYERILLEFGIAVYPREGYNIGELRDHLLSINPAFRIRLLSMPLVNVSSTQLREALDKGEDVSDLLM